MKKCDRMQRDRICIEHVLCHTTVCHQRCVAFEYFHLFFSVLCSSFAISLFFSSSLSLFLHSSFSFNLQNVVATFFFIFFFFFFFLPDLSSYLLFLALRIHHEERFARSPRFQNRAGTCRSIRLGRDQLLSSAVLRPQESVWARIHLLLVSNIVPHASPWVAIRFSV